ncbi:MAG TPA: hypothetical protein VG477_18045, partial [Thermoanaerobaculia bacterium]|nr:hypothetical protein [Thermoanaerobaculia bacterium]
MNLRNLPAFGPRLLAAALCLFALSALPVRAQEEPYFPHVPDYGANSGNCAMNVSVQFEATCGLTMANFMGGLQKTGTKDPLFCNNECMKCCDFYNTRPDSDFWLVDSVCRCAEGLLITGGFGILECVAPASINAAFTAGLIDEQQRMHGIAARDLFLAGKLNLEYILRHNIRTHGQVVTYLKTVLPEGLPGAGIEANIEDLARGVLALVGLGATYIDVCHLVDEEFDEAAIQACKGQCNRWFPDPPQPEPEPQPHPEGPTMSG